MPLILSLLAACSFEGSAPGDGDGDASVDKVEVTRTFQQGAGYMGVIDTELDEDNPTEDKSGLTEMRIDSQTGQRGVAMSLIRFDDIFGAGADQIPADAEIIGATLSVTVTDNGAPSDLCEMIRSWTGAIVWADFGPGGPQPSADFDPTSIAMLPGPAERTELDVLASIQSWHQGDRANDGWLFFPSSSSGTTLATSETDPTTRPTLVVRLLVDP